MATLDFFQRQRDYQAASLQMYGLVILGIAACTLPIGYLLDLVLSYTLVPLGAGLYCLVTNDPKPYLPIFRFMNSDSARLWGTVCIALIIAFRLMSLARARQDALDQTGSEFARRLGAQELKGIDQDRLLQILRNVTEEMGIASGAGYVRPYVLEGDHGINGIAIGIPQKDVALIVTRRALDVLDRPELQALVAHVMSFIVHGDIRRDLRFAAWVDTLGLMYQAGKIMISPPSERRSSDKGGNPFDLIVLPIGGTLALCGWLGRVFARSAQAVVYRLRERMADAAAIQFTRDQDSLVRVLKKIPTTPGESVIHIAGALPLKHLFFAPIDHQGRQMSELARLFGDNDRSIRERLESLAPGEDWSRM